MKARLTIIVLAAGKGTRMRSDRPKLLFELCGRPMLSYVLQSVRALKPDKTVVVVSHGKERIKESLAHEKGLTFVDQGEPRGTGHALQVSQTQWGNSDQVLVVCGDTPMLRGETLRHFVGCHREHEIQGVSLLTANTESPYGYGRILRDEKGNVLGIREEADANEEEKQIQEINTGIYLFDTNQLKLALKNLKPNNKQKELYLTDTLAEIRQAGSEVHAHRSHDFEETMGVNSIAELAWARKQMQWRILDQHMKNGVDIIDPDTTFIDADVEIGANTVILPMTAIRGKIHIGSHCEIGPFTHLRTGSVIEDGAEVGNFTEVKKSRIGRKSKAKHLSYLGDATIGDGVNIGAGTITANYDGKGKYQTLIRDGAFVGSGTVIVAPAVVGKKAITGAGAVITKGTQVPESAVYVGIPAKPLQKKATSLSRKMKKVGGSSNGQ